MKLSAIAYAGVQSRTAVSKIIGLMFVPVCTLVHKLAKHKIIHMVGLKRKTRLRPPSLMYYQGKSARVYALRMHCSLGNTSKMAADDTYCNISIPNHLFYSSDNEQGLF